MVSPVYPILLRKINFCYHWFADNVIKLIVNNDYNIVNIVNDNKFKHFFLKNSRNGVNGCGQGDLAIDCLVIRHLWSHLCYLIWENKTTVDSACTQHIEHPLVSTLELHILVQGCCSQWLGGCNLVNRRLIIMKRSICPCAKQCFVFQAILKYLSAVFWLKSHWRQILNAVVSQVYSLWLQYIILFYTIKMNCSCSNCKGS